MAAALFQKKDMVKLLIDNGAGVNAKNKDGRSLLSIAVGTSSLSLNKNTRAILKLIIEKRINIDEWEHVIDTSYNLEVKNLLQSALRTNH